jgi:phenylpropionate dioxygenase-like ring-hydroxylating dioxygenase large terminal subunit
MSLSDYWYVLCRSSALAAQPVAVQLLDQPIALFRVAAARPVALLDRCPHRNVPLSLGTMRADVLECRYHGWSFDERGLCVGVPGRSQAVLPSACVPRFATREQDGYIWAWGRPDVAPSVAPYRIDPSSAGHAVLHASADYPADLRTSLENTIDVPHTAFLHRGLFRSTALRQRVSCTITRNGREVSASYAGESRPATWFARLLAPGGGVLEHEDRFVAPCIVRVEYRLGPRAHLLSTVFFTPLDDHNTRLHVQIAYRLGVPAGWLSPLLGRVAARVLREDVAILAEQTKNQRRFAGKSYVSTELDAFSGQIQRLVAQLEDGQLADEQSQQQIELMM